MKKSILLIAIIAAIAHATFGQTWQYNGWHLLEVDGGQPANWASLAFNSPVETWSIAYRRSGYLRIAEYFGGGGYYDAIVAAGGQGASLAYSPNGIASMSHVASGRLMVVMRAGTSWNSVQVDPKDVDALTHPSRMTRWRAASHEINNRGLFARGTDPVGLPNGG
jgi:predicted methyltransferase